MAVVAVYPKAVAHKVQRLVVAALVLVRWDHSVITLKCGEATYHNWWHPSVANESPVPLQYDPSQQFNLLPPKLHQVLITRG